MAYVDIELDLQILICTFLRPSDILTLRKTCKALQLATRQRIIWIYALRRVCIENTLFLPSFPIHDMSDVELEQAAIAPRRWIEVSTSLARKISDWDAGHSLTSTLPPTATRIIYSPFGLIDSLFLVPGGRYMVARSQNGLGVWDLGYKSSADCKLIAFDLEPGGYLPTYKIHPTPDGMGLVIFSLHLDCSIYEIYPQSENPKLTKMIASHDLDFVDGFYAYVSVDKMIWVSLYLQETIFRVWDYRLKASVSFATLANVGAKDGVEVIPTPTAIVVLKEKEISIWKIPPLSPQPPNFDDYSLPQFPPAFTIKFPDVPSCNPSRRSIRAAWKIMSFWYLDPSKPLYFDKVYWRDFEVQRFKIIIEPDLSDATLHYINTLRPANLEYESGTPFQSMFCEDTPVYSWSVSPRGYCTGSTLLPLPGPSPYPSTGMFPIMVRRDKSHSPAGICSASGRVVRGSSNDEIVVYDFLPPQRL